MSKNKGFTLKCNECGRKLILTGNDFYNIQLNNQFHNKLFLGINWGYEEVQIECECGNEIDG